MESGYVKDLAGRLIGNIQKVIVGKESVIELMLTSIIARGHILMEDVPGTGKTVLAKSLSRSLSCDFSRIQFTPDLLPSDVTGISVYDARTGEFEFKPGPVFTNVLLADEINRATPRTQSALLECMEERQVTYDGITRTLEEPFLVIATQNPIETQGTFALPEAQLDRFLMRLKLGYPDTDDSMRILKRFIEDDPLSELKPCATGEEIRTAQALVKKAQVSAPVLEYIVAVCEATRTAPNVQMGASPRGMLALMRAAQALALIRGRDFVTPDDVKLLAAPVLAHRLIVRGAYGQVGEAETIIAGILSAVAVPTEAPEGA